MSVTLAQFGAIFPGVSEVWAYAFKSACAEFGIDTPARLAAFFAQVGHESAGLTRLEESFAYKPDRLRAVFPKKFRTVEAAAEYVRRGPEAIANFVYGLRMGNGSESSGDGFRFRCRGPIGLTGKNNYQRHSKALGVPIETNPDLLKSPGVGARSAGLYWEETNCNRWIDAGDFDGVCDVVNIGMKSGRVGDSNGFSDRLDRWMKYKTVLGVA